MAGTCECDNEWDPKNVGNSWLAGYLLVSQEGRWSMKIFN